MSATDDGVVYRSGAAVNTSPDGVTYPDVLTTARLNAMMLEKSSEVDDALKEYREASAGLVEIERTARRAHAFAYVKAKTEHPKAAVALIEAFIDTDDECDEATTQAEHARMLRDTSKEALRARQAQLSALQSLASATREEMRLAR